MDALLELQQEWSKMSQTIEVPAHLEEMALGGDAGSREKARRATGWGKEKGQGEKEGWQTLCIR